jgi:hypothetical protein
MPTQPSDMHWHSLTTPGATSPNTSFVHGVVPLSKDLGSVQAGTTSLPYVTKPVHVQMAPSSAQVLVVLFDTMISGHS